MQVTTAQAMDKYKAEWRTTLARSEAAGPATIEPPQRPATGRSHGPRRGRWGFIVGALRGGVVAERSDVVTLPVKELQLLLAAAIFDASSNLAIAIRARKRHAKGSPASESAMRRWAAASLRSERAAHVTRALQIAREVTQGEDEDHVEILRIAWRCLERQIDHVLTPPMGRPRMPGPMLGAKFLRSDLRRGRRPAMSRSDQAHLLAYIAGVKLRILVSRNLDAERDEPAQTADRETFEILARAMGRKDVARSAVDRLMSNDPGPALVWLRRRAKLESDPDRPPIEPEALLDRIVGDREALSEQKVQARCAGTVSALAKRLQRARRDQRFKLPEWPNSG